MKKVSIKTMWHGKYVSVSEEEFEDAKRMGGLEITHDGDVMQILPEELSRLTPNPTIYKCKYKKGRTYRLVDIVFKPEDTRQAELF